MEEGSSPPTTRCVAIIVKQYLKFSNKYINKNY